MENLINRKQIPDFKFQNKKFIHTSSNLQLKAAGMFLTIHNLLCMLLFRFQNVLGSEKRNN